MLRRMWGRLVRAHDVVIAVWTIAMIVAHLALTSASIGSLANWPLFAALAAGSPLVGKLFLKLLRRQFGSDLLAGISIVVSIFLEEYLAGSFVVLMLSGGEALEQYAVHSASAVLRALSKRMPSVGHRKVGPRVEDIPLPEIAIGDAVVIFPHEACPVDGTVIEGHGTMDESYLTGEPYIMSKTPGSAVLSGAINGPMALVVRADALARDSRYAKIMKVMQASEEKRPRIRRLGDWLGAIYTPIAIGLALLAFFWSGDPRRFLSVLVVATPCPLLIGIPVAIIGSISLAAKRSIIVRDPSALETADTCRTIIFDKTGTLTYGEPRLQELIPAAGFDAAEILAQVSSLERYSKHPLSAPFLRAAEGARSVIHDVSEISERPGEGLRGTVAGRRMYVTNRAKLVQSRPEIVAELPPIVGGMECVILIDERLAATCRFRDQPRGEGASFVNHLAPKHFIHRTMLVSGDRESEVKYLADEVGITNVYFNQSPEEKLAIVNAETAKAKTIFVGDGINDAPALLAATVGIAFGQNNDVTTEAGDVVVLDSSLERVDEFLHISRRMRTIALQSALGGMALSVLGMIAAAFGYLPPVAGAISQELIDVLAVLNALRAALPGRKLSDFD
jgi:heavy metal translocating P-type ATPase